MQRQLLSMFGALAAVGFVAGASPAKADVIFGNLAAPAGCGAVSGVGAVCGVNETFTSGADTVVAHGFTGPPSGAGGNANLTFKPIPPNSLAESGLGVQSNNTATTCTNPDCEILPPQSVSATRSGSTLITDAVIGSVQAGEEFNFLVQTAEGGAFSQLNSAPIDNTCSFPGGSVAGANECQWNAPAGQTRFGVAVQAVTGDETLLSISTLAQAVPEPASLALLGSGLLGLGLLWRRRRKV